MLKTYVTRYQHQLLGINYVTRYQHQLLGINISYQVSTMLLGINISYQVSTLLLGINISYQVLTIYPVTMYQLSLIIQMTGGQSCKYLNPALTRCSYSARGDVLSTSNLNFAPVSSIQGNSFQHTRKHQAKHKHGKLETIPQHQLPQST